MSPVPSIVIAWDCMGNGSFACGVLVSSSERVPMIDHHPGGIV